MLIRFCWPTAHGILRRSTNWRRHLTSSGLRACSMSGTFNASKQGPKYENFSFQRDFSCFSMMTPILSSCTSNILHTFVTTKIKAEKHYIIIEKSFHVSLWIMYCNVIIWMYLLLLYVTELGSLPVMSSEHIEMLSWVIVFNPSEEKVRSLLQGLDLEMDSLFTVDCALWYDVLGRSQINICPGWTCLWHFTWTVISWSWIESSSNLLEVKQALAVCTSVNKPIREM